jgi:hypothetical protein
MNQIKRRIASLQISLHDGKKAGYGLTVKLYALYTLLRLNSIFHK